MSSVITRDGLEGTGREGTKRRSVPPPLLREEVRRSHVPMKGDALLSFWKWLMRA
jgi:hypothetical protein